MKIIGAGLSGLICGALNPGSTIFERQSELPNNHGALLRFRSDKISKALGIPFKKVRVTKGIWFNNDFVQPNPLVQNLYSQKVLGKLSSRSIANISPVDRYIAPPDFIQQLADRCDIVYGCDFPNGKHFTAYIETIISTIPMPVMIKLLDLTVPSVKFEMREIWTRKYYLPGADIYQTVYFPSAHSYVYRASFSGEELICEFTADPSNVGVGLSYICNSFGISEKNLQAKDSRSFSQKYGKIAPIDNDVRKLIMSNLTHDHQIYSLGRYATWRNILLDDVFEDIFKIRDLMRMDSYSRRIATAEEK